MQKLWRTEHLWNYGACFLVLTSYLQGPINSRPTVDSLTSSGIIFITWNSHQNVHQLIKPVSVNMSTTFIFFSGIVFLHYLIKDPTEFLKRWLQALSCLGGYIILEMLKMVHFLWNHFRMIVPDCLMVPEQTACHLDMSGWQGKMAWVLLDWRHPKSFQGNTST